MIRIRHINIINQEKKMRKKYNYKETEKNVKIYIFFTKKENRK